MGIEEKDICYETYSRVVLPKLGVLGCGCVSYRNMLSMDVLALNMDL